MSTEKMQMRTNARLIAKVLTKYRDTFYALKELINNSLYANASRIDINFIPSECDQDSVNFRPVEKIEIIDNDFNNFIFNENEKVNNIITNNTTEKCSKIKIDVKTCCMEIYQENIIDLLPEDKVEDVYQRICY